MSANSHTSSLVQCDVSSTSLPIIETSFLLHGDTSSELYSTEFTSVHRDLSAEVKTNSLWSFLLGPQHLMFHSKTNRWISPSPCQQMLQPALSPPLLNLQGQESSFYLHWGNSSCWGCPHWNSTERAPGHLVNWDILSTATCKEK